MTDDELCARILTTDPEIVGVHVGYLFHIGEDQDALRIQRLRHELGALEPDFEPIEVHPRHSEPPAGTGGH